MRKLLAGFFAFSLCLAAADFWQSKPAAQWSDKDVQKMMSNSPWARPFSMSTSGPTPPSLGGAAGNSIADDTGAPQPISAGGGGRGGRSSRGAASADAPSAGSGGGAPITIVARWQSALPVKQAFARLQYGAQAGTSEEAKEAIQREEASYLIVLSGTLTPFLHGDAQTLKQTLMDASSLSAKGKAVVKPADLQFLSNRRAIEIVMAFPKSAPFMLEDKEVEFSTRLGKLALKYKFKLKDMVYNGKLEM